MVSEDKIGDIRNVYNSLLKRSKQLSTGAPLPADELKTLLAGVNVELSDKELATLTKKIGGKDGAITETQFLEFVTKIDLKGYRRTEESGRWIETTAALDEIWSMVNVDGGELMSVDKLQQLMNTFGITHSEEEALEMIRLLKKTISKKNFGNNARGAIVNNCLQNHFWSSKIVKSFFDRNLKNVLLRSQKPKDGEEARDPAAGLSKKDFCQILESKSTVMGTKLTAFQQRLAQFERPRN